jgi:transposase-like protein
MHKTRTSLLVWFWAIYLVSNDKRGTSGAQLSQQFSISYPTAWLMLHKIRKAISNRDAKYTLAGIVEMDDTFIGAPTEGGKRGRGTEKTKVVASLSLNKSGHPLYLKMNVVEDIKASTLSEVACKTIVPGTAVSTDLFRSYNQLSKDGYIHLPKEFNYEDNPDHLKWLHTIISNAKFFIAGTYHGLGPKHLQFYLDEFCYRFNRRKFKGQLFNRLLNACASTSTVTYDELVAQPC